MKKILSLSNLLKISSVLSLCLLCIACHKDKTNSDVALIRTGDISELTPVTAISGGEVLDEGAFPVFTRGVVWGLTKNPTIDEHEGITSDGLGIGTFSSEIDGLTPNTIYFIRAYAINNSGTGYGQNISVTTPDGVIDADGNVYNVVVIGTQTWMRENLKTTKYNDLTDIPIVTGSSAWTNMTTPAYCWFNNSSDYKDPYGALYNWYTVGTGKLCPTGWHVPTMDEFNVLFTYLGGKETAAYKLKEAGTDHWNAPNTGATNSSGFTALAAGARETNGSFYYLGVYVVYWASDVVSSSSADYWWLAPNIGNVYTNSYSVKAGLSIRCLKDQ
jgi:uncharacterized protein (TIGR02145 family)